MLKTIIAGLQVIFVFGVVPMLPALGVWFLLVPTTYWQTLATLIFGAVVYAVAVVALCYLIDAFRGD